MTPAFEAAEIAALGAIFGSLGATVIEVGGWTVLSRPDRPGHPWMHQVVARGDVSADDLDEALSLAGPTAQVQVPDGVLGPAALVSRGFAVWSRLVRMVGAVPGPPVPGPPGAASLVAASPVVVSSASGSPAASGLSLSVVGPEAAAEVVAVGLAGFDVGESDWWPAPLGAPGWSQVLAHEGAVPVAMGALHVSGPVAWVGAASTVPGHRRRGAQSALLAHRFQLAAQGGAEQIVSKVDPGGGSERNLRRAGFQPAYEVVQWRRH